MRKMATGGLSAIQKRLLLISANPMNAGFLRLDAEIRDIELAIHQSACHESMIVRKCQGLRMIDLKRELRSFRPTHIHFAGHGNAQGILLVDDNDNSRLMKFKSLGRLLDLFSGRLECVFLNCCYSARYACDMGRHIPAVIGMSGKVDDETALQFARDFYAGLGKGIDITFSFRRALAAMAPGHDNKTPCLFAKGKRLFG